MTCRFLTKTLNRTSSSWSAHSVSSSGILFTQRHCSTQSGKVQMMEVDLDSSSPNDDVRTRELEDMLHKFMVKQSAPDWLPFRPGSCYWVPRPPRGVVEILANLTKPRARLSQEESLSLSTVRGWPSSSYFAQGTSSTRTDPVKVKLEAMVDKEAENAPSSEDVEG